jgi:ABC-2 type transport system ATP-binding protein
LTTNYVLEFTRELADRGKTVVFSAHNLYHVESVCDRVVIMNRGQIVARGTVEQIRAEHGSTSYHVFTTCAVEGSEPAGDEHRTIVDDMTAVEELRTEATDAGGRVTDIRTREPSLEDLFLDIAGQPLESDPRAEATR